MAIKSDAVWEISHLISSKNLTPNILFYSIPYAYTNQKQNLTPSHILLSPARYYHHNRPHYNHTSTSTSAWTANPTSIFNSTSIINPISVINCTNRQEIDYASRSQIRYQSLTSYHTLAYNNKNWFAYHYHSQEQQQQQYTHTLLWRRIYDNAFKFASTTCFHHRRAKGEGKRGLGNEIEWRGDSADMKCLIWHDPIAPTKHQSGMKHSMALVVTRFWLLSNQHQLINQENDFPSLGVYTLGADNVRLTLSNSRVTPAFPS